MQIEHLAFNIEDAPGMIAWYERHLGMPVWWQSEAPVYVAFLGEPPSLLEIYKNPERPYLQPAGLDPATLHLAFTSHDLEGDLQRLVAAGATHLEGEPDYRGEGLIMLRCPWGLPLQLCRRTESLVRPRHPG